MLHATTNFLVEVPTDVTAKMEAAGLANNQILLTLLAFQIGCVVLLIKANKTIPNLARVFLFYVVCAGGVAIECRVQLFKDGVKDLGFGMLSGVKEWMESDALVNGALAAANTCIVIGGCSYSVVTGLRDGRWHLLAKGATCIVVRMVFGLATQLPVPAGYNATDGDWPPANASCVGFIFNPSGHVLGMMLLGLELRRRGWGTAALVNDAVNVAQAVRLIALQGHYSVDVLTAVLIGLAVDPRVEAALEDGDGKAHSD